MAGGTAAALCCGCRQLPALSCCPPLNSWSIKSESLLCCVLVRKRPPGGVGALGVRERCGVELGGGRGGPVGSQGALGRLAADNCPASSRPPGGALHGTEPL